MTLIKPTLSSLRAAENGSSENANPIEQFASEEGPTTPRALPTSDPERPPSPLQDLRGDGGRQQAVRLIAAAALLIAIVEAAIIGRLLYMRGHAPPPADSAVVIEFTRPGADVLVDGRPAGVTPLKLKVGAHTGSIRVVSRESDPAALESSVAVEAPDRRDQRPAGDRPVGDPQPARPQRSSGVKVSSPFEIQVLEGNRPLGSSKAGIVFAAVGRHELDLVNSALGYRSRRIVDIKPGQVVSLAVNPPNGSLSINALPWAEVWLDGNALGQTPLGNVSVPLGEHEIVFRHPELGERREKTIVRSDRLTLVSANFQQ